MSTIQSLFVNAPLMAIGMVLVMIYLLFWIFVSVSISVSKRARELFSEFLPQWFARKGRPFTTKEKIGACFQLVAVLIIIALLFVL